MVKKCFVLFITLAHLCSLVFVKDLLGIANPGALADHNPHLILGHALEFSACKTSAVVKLAPF